ncbi:phytanoyl-CoA dioxygenase [Microthyrium microscopicum]|uniref:Phytanoyl-CoA dioxygenase n=1 Tax=Microthyrium microscopicum TaxID=703497 RepID=A0A6A6U526_9PEZI|nr:phytanoyl-CoA dioxygenase [Microthyrium microscopicum]
MSTTSILRASLARDGFVIIPKAIREPRLTQLRLAAHEAAQLARAGKWQWIRTLPKQFPPWKESDISHGIWGVQHLLHPSMPNSSLFASSYFDSTIMSPAKELLSTDSTACKDGDLVMELYNLLIRPDHDFELVWHRDDIPPTATAEEERERLGGKAWHAQWNLALYDDASLIVVPGSHVRARTEEERNADPKEKVLSGMIVVKLEAGDVVFYNNNILHRGVYDSTVERLTLHGSVGHLNGQAERARNVLQHGVGSWVGEADFGELDGETRKRAEGMRERLVEMGKAAGEVGYFQEDV